MESHRREMKKKIQQSRKLRAPKLERYVLYTASEFKSESEETSSKCQPMQLWFHADSHIVSFAQHE